MRRGAALRSVANTRVLLLGTVVSERSISRPPNTEPAWESVVVAHAVLKGEAPDEPLLIPYIGFLGADCSGGPRLREGERVLIPVYWGRVSYGGGEEGWRLHGIFSKVLIEDGQATLEWAYDGSEPLGDAETVIREYGLAVGAGDAQIEAAVAAALAPAPAGLPGSGAPVADALGDDGGVPGWAVGAGVVVAVCVAGLIMVRLRARAGAEDT